MLLCVSVRTGTYVHGDLNYFARRCIPDPWMHDECAAPESIMLDQPRHALASRCLICRCCLIRCVWTAPLQCSGARHLRRQGCLQKVSARWPAGSPYAFGMKVKKPRHDGFEQHGVRFEPFNLKCIRWVHSLPFAGASQ